MIRVEHIAATKWRQVIYLRRAGYYVRFFQSVEFPELFRGVRRDADGGVTVKWACDDEPCVSINDVAVKLNRLRRGDSEDERLAWAISEFGPVDFMEVYR